MRSEDDHIFHIALAEDWEAAKRVGEYRVSTRGRGLDEVGFIHGSFQGQVERIGSFHYAMTSDPVSVLDINTRRLTAPIRIENLDGGAELFPHIYGPIPIDAVDRAIPASTVGGRFIVE